MRADRAAGVVLASAAADALGAPHEFGPPLAADRSLAMTGGGSFGWAPGEWTDDTQQSLAVLRALVDVGPGRARVLGAVEDGLRAWFAAAPRDVGIQTGNVLHRDDGGPGGLPRAAADYQAGHADSAGNGSLMRTGPVGLAAGGDLDAVAELAASVSRLTHPHPDAVEACVLWSVAIARAIEAPVGPPPDWVDLVTLGLAHIPAERRDQWRNRLEACRTTPAESFLPNGWVVTALQAALAAAVQTATPAEGPPCGQMQLAIERAVRIGGDTDTVGAIAGALLGAFWGATAVPYRWRRRLHGEAVGRAPVFAVADLDRQARLAYAGGPDGVGWPDVASLMPHYRRSWWAAPRSAELTERVVLANVHAVPDLVDDVDAVVSLCRMGASDVPDHLEHHVIGLIDSEPADNPNLAFVLADTADLVAALVRAHKKVLVHCVQAQSRTPAVASAYLIRHHGMPPERALERVEALLGTGPETFLRDAVRALPPGDHLEGGSGE